MSLSRTTVMVLVPGKSTVCFELDYRLPSTLFAVLVATTMFGATLRHALGPRLERARTAVHAEEITGSLQSLAWPEPASDRSFVAVRTSSPWSRGTHRAPRILSALIPAPRAARVAAIDPLVPADADLALRVTALHLGESLELKPFDSTGTPQPAAFSALQHLMRCRVSGEETAIDPRLVRILAQVSATYHRPIQLVSGHRKPYVIGTKPTSQHALGRAADIRVAGVGIEELRALVIRLGARGVGLYPEKGFIHVDVREKPRYFWTYSEAAGEEPDMSLIGAGAAFARHASGE